MWKTKISGCAADLFKQILIVLETWGPNHLGDSLASF
jgi:hypothetical protein